MTTTLDLIADLTSISTRAASEHRDVCASRFEASHTDMKSYREGQAAAYNDAHKLMQRELERLRNLWQNGSLRADDFGLPS